MYCKFFEFSEKPFNVTPDPRFLFLTESHREALDAMEYGIRERRGFVSIMGEVGTGKTILIRHLPETLHGKKVRTVFLYQTINTFDQMLKEILLELKIPLGDESKTSMIRQLNENLIQRLAGDENLAIIIDDAQDLSQQVLADLRLLSKLETNNSKLLQVLLVGQPELEAKLSSPELRQIKQRIAIGRQIRPLNAEESRQYIEHRLGLVGSNINKVFEPEALSVICENARGIPRTINMLCDNAFLIGYGLAQKKIGSNIIKKVSKDMGLSTPEKPVELKAVLHQRAMAWRKQYIPWAGYWRVGILALIIACLGLAFFVGRDNNKSAPSNLEATTSGLKPIKQTPAPETSSETKAESNSTVTPTPVLKPKPVSPETPQPRTISSASEIPFRTESRVKEIATVESGDTIISLSQRYYQMANITLLDKIMGLNPEITDPNHIQVGQKITVPEITEESLIIPSPDGTYNVHLATFSEREYADSYTKELALEGRPIEIMPRKVFSEVTWYRVFAGGFSNKGECLRVIDILKEKGLLQIPGKRN